MSAQRFVVPDEPAHEHLTNALQLLHILTSFEMSSAEAVRHEETLLAIRARIEAARTLIMGARKT